MRSRCCNIVFLCSHLKDVLEALKSLSSFFDENNIRSRRNLRSDIERRSLVINEEFVECFRQVKEVIMTTNSVHIYCSLVQSSYSYCIFCTVVQHLTRFQRIQCISWTFVIAEPFVCELEFLTISFCYYFSYLYPIRFTAWYHA